MNTGSEGEKRALCSNILIARQLGATAEETARKLGCDEGEVQSIWGKFPKHASCASSGDNAPCLFPQIMCCVTERSHQLTFKVFADRWWCYRDWCRSTGTTPEELADWVINLPHFHDIRELVLKNRKPANLAVWLRKDVLKWASVYGTSLQNPAVVSAKAVSAVACAIADTNSVSAKELGLQIKMSAKKVCRALKVLGWSSSPGRGHKWQAPDTGKGTYTETRPPVVVPADGESNEEAHLVTIEVLPASETVQVNLGDLDFEIAELLAQIDVELHVGPGGSGKTTEVTKKYNRCDAVRCAPTNAIALGLTRTQKQLWTTIHTGLRIPVNSKWEAGKIRKRLVIIDEFSLVGSELFVMILRRLLPPSKAGERTKLVILGDFFQLPPAHSSHGDYPLRDLIGLSRAKSSNISLVEYSGNRRAQSPALAEAIEAIRHGLMPMSDRQGGFQLEVVEDDHICTRGAGAIVESYRLNPGLDTMGVATLKGVVGGDYGACGISDTVVGRVQVCVGDIVLINETCKKKSRLKGLHAQVMRVCPVNGFRLGWIGTEMKTPVFDWFQRNEFVRRECVNVHSVQGLSATGVVAVLEYSTKGCCTREALYVMVSRAISGCLLITSERALKKALAKTAPYIPSGWAELYQRRHGKSVARQQQYLIAA